MRNSEIRRTLPSCSTRDVKKVNMSSALSTRGCHAVRFYDNSKSLAQIVAAFLSEGLAAGQPGIVVATPRHRAAILRELVAVSVDVVAAQRSSDFVLLDAENTLSTFMTDGSPTPDKFKSSMCEVIKRACGARADCTVRIYGEMVDLLWKEGNQQGAIRLEMLWNNLANTEAFSLLCGYSMGHFYKEANFADICGQHTHVVAADGTASDAA
jgi:MEDS: MEthanogen/methylotroph, DcmR Sensory domain